ncbi:DUF6879 family protein [Streptomyces malaysiense]|uniref:DUF6879 domain-containing protein n=1 Tax=Streptomyces malaysiense TaxID=1428626 RepID=A0A1J4PX80_9ACTN|nr:hypothetical protein VT52_021150 [Streptomyces malaysiense]
MSEPVTDCIRFEHAITDANCRADEQVRWLPRSRASILALPGNDFWLIDGRLVRWNLFSGDGHAHEPDHTDDPQAVKLCAEAFRSVWELATDHADHLTRLDAAEATLKALSVRLLRSSQAAEHLAGIAGGLVDIDGALHFGCLLNLAKKPEGALWWWQYAAGASDATAAYCLHLFHLRRGELRDADHWMCQALDLGYDIGLALAHRPTWPVQPRVRHPQALREAVERLSLTLTRK